MGSTWHVPHLILTPVLRLGVAFSSVFCSLVLWRGMEANIQPGANISAWVQEFSKYLEILSSVTGPTWPSQGDNQPPSGWTHHPNSRRHLGGWETLFIFLASFQDPPEKRASNVEDFPTVFPGMPSPALALLAHRSGVRRLKISSAHSPSFLR